LKRIALALLPALLGCLPDVMVAEPRYFAPLAPAAPAETPAAWPGEAPLLRLRRVQSAVHLRERIVWRRSEAEFGFRELERWTQPPADWVEQWLARELFERRGLRRAIAGPHPLLQVDVLAFDEVLEPERAARVELTARLSDARGQALLERTYAAQQPLGGRDPGELSRAMGAALAGVVARLGGDASEALSALGP
jgi:ABC-type uncharacterized transport system auxiliary subunit